MQEVCLLIEAGKIISKHTTPYEEKPYIIFSSLFTDCFYAEP